MRRTVRILLILVLLPALRSVVAGWMNAGQGIIEIVAVEFGKAFVAYEFRGGGRSGTAAGFV